ncbi:hypothetical protein [Arthrobacter zhaoguopingii]|uniref:hypothetical protein n=1 Tax=Arthrobacter zhaoguopingii TaxID=2681491 RepID=UPI00135BCA13|nr:hypothetical protein [Arthrobacter zhaoguopingii]
MNKQESEPLLVEHLSKSFRGVRRVEDVSFTVGAAATGALTVLTALLLTGAAFTLKRRSL